MPAIKDASPRSVGGVVEDTDGCLGSALWESGLALLTGVVWSKGSELGSREPLTTSQSGSWPRATDLPVVDAVFIDRVDRARSSPRRLPRPGRG